EADAVAVLAGLDAEFCKQILRLHRHHARFAIGERHARRLQHRSAGAAAPATPAPRPPPPPIHPATIVPSGRMIALAPAFAAVTDTVRTTVASTKVCSADFICATNSITSTCAVIGGSIRALPDRVRARSGCSAYWPARRDRHAA